MMDDKHLHIEQWLKDAAQPSAPEPTGMDVKRQAWSKMNDLLDAAATTGAAAGAGQEPAPARTVMHKILAGIKQMGVIVPTVAAAAVVTIVIGVKLYHNTDVQTKQTQGVTNERAHEAENNAAADDVPAPVKDSGATTLSGIQPDNVANASSLGGNVEATAATPAADINGPQHDNTADKAGWKNGATAGTNNGRSGVNNTGVTPPTGADKYSDVMGPRDNDTRGIQPSAANKNGTLDNSAAGHRPSARGNNTGKPIVPGHNMTGSDAMRPNGGAGGSSAANGRPQRNSGNGPKGNIGVSSAGIPGGDNRPPRDNNNAFSGNNSKSSAGNNNITSGGNNKPLRNNSNRLNGNNGTSSARNNNVTPDGNNKPLRDNSEGTTGSNNLSSSGNNNLLQENSSGLTARQPGVQLLHISNPFKVGKPALSSSSRSLHIPYSSLPPAKQAWQADGSRWAMQAGILLPLSSTPGGSIGSALGVRLGVLYELPLWGDIYLQPFIGMGYITGYDKRYTYLSSGREKIRDSTFVIDTATTPYTVKRTFVGNGGLNLTYTKGRWSVGTGISFNFAIQSGVQDTTTHRKIPFYDTTGLLGPITPATFSKNKLPGLQSIGWNLDVAYYILPRVQTGLNYRLLLQQPSIDPGLNVPARFLGGANDSKNKGVLDKSMLELYIRIRLGR